MIIVIDNYDSFTFNLVQYFGDLGEKVAVYRNDEITVDQIRLSDPKAVVISPGPGRPRDAGVSLSTIIQLGSTIPILGVCLGHQSIGAAFGSSVISAERLMHGKTSLIFSNSEGLFYGLKVPFQACRYHSLILERKSLPECLEVTAVTEEQEIMGIRHKHFPIEGVQFHPESILTPDGKQILKNFLNMVQEFRQTHKWPCKSTASLLEYRFEILSTTKPVPAEKISNSMAGT